MLLFAAPGTAQRLPSLLEWEEWGARGRADGRTGEVPPLLCHGAGDAVTVPAPVGGPARSGSRWLVAPDTRLPWLPGPEILLWAAVRAAPRGGADFDFSSRRPGCQGLRRQQAPLAQLVRAADS